MKIAVAQIKTAKGNIPQNIERHKSIIHLAVSRKATAVFFSELSITGYEPTIAKELAIDIDDQRFDVFQEISDTENIIIAIGVPLNNEQNPKIGMLIFQARKPRTTYAKQILHTDEHLFFVPGGEQAILTNAEWKIAPAICYESLQNSHITKAIDQGANIYLASVAKSQKGVDQVNQYFPMLAKKYSIPVLMSNCTGYCDNFDSVGQSAVWNEHGERLAQLHQDQEGILTYDTKTQTVIVDTLENS